VAKTGLTIVKDNTARIFKQLEQLMNKQVLVGIPDSGQNVRGEEPVNNATIGYVMEFGSPLHNVPARPFLIPGVEKARSACLVQLRQAAAAALKGDKGGMLQGLNRAGILASNEVKMTINSNIPPPLKPGTIRNRHRGRDTKMRESEQVYLGLVAKGAAPGAAQIDVGIIALVNTGQLRNSITYVVRDKTFNATA
jgi:hypothetical protein